MTVEQKYLFNLLLDRFKLHKVLRVSDLVRRFINNGKKKKKKKKKKKIRALTATEVQCQEMFYIKREQRKVKD